MGSSRVYLGLEVLRRDSVCRSWSSSVCIKANFASSGPTLEEIARIFDGDDAEVADIDLAIKSLEDRKEKDMGVHVEKAEASHAQPS